MPKYDKYHPDYGRLYPEIQARPDVLSVLKKSDRKMEYMEVDIKQERFSYDPEGKVADLLPSREDSYDRLIEEEHHQFALDEPSPENMLLQEEELHLLRAALLLLTAEEKELIDALFYSSPLFLLLSAKNCRKSPALRECLLRSLRRPCFCNYRAKGSPPLGSPGAHRNL